MYKIIVSKPLQKFTNNVREVNLDADSYFNLYSNLANLFPELKTLGDSLKFNKKCDLWFVVDGKMLPKDHILLNPRRNVTIMLVPLIKGSGDDFLFIGIGIALIALSFAIAPAAGAVAAGEIAALTGTGFAGAVGASTGSIAATMALNLGLSLVLSGVMKLVLGSPTQNNNNSTQDSGSRVDNDSFAALENTTKVNTSIPLIYGYHRVPGQFVDGKIKTINHDRDTVISVANYV